MISVFDIDGYYKIAAESKEQAEKLAEDEELIDDIDECVIEEVEPSKHKMWFPVEELPEEYHDESKYPRKNWCGEYTGVEITLSEAVENIKEDPPYVLSISSELV